MATSVMQVRVSLQGSKPPIWRRVAAPSDITLGTLHEVIQITMGWTNSHMHHFILRSKRPKPKPRKSLPPTGPSERKEIILPDGRRGVTFTITPAPNLPGATPAQPSDRASANHDRYFITKTSPWGDPNELPGEDEDAITLGELCPKVKDKLIYEYDFGDGWEHLIEVQKIFDPEPGVEYPVCLAGKEACPPEDCGGIWGYYDLLDAVADPDNEEHDELSEWLGPEFDPHRFDLEEVNVVLSQWRRGGDTGRIGPF